MKSFIRWAGSKRLLLGHLRTYWRGEPRRYIEPFCGSACFFFDVQPHRAILGDLNEELICAFRAIKRDPYLVLECMRRFPRGATGYYKVRAMQPVKLAENERAARFIYLNRYCFNGIYRTNANGEFNVPYGPPKSGRPADEALVIAASKILESALLMHGDFEHTLQYAQPGDFVYLDPPYCLDSRRVFKEYLPGSFSLADLARLRDQLCRLDEMNASFLVSYADCAEARRLLKPWNPRRIRARRHIAGFSDHRRSAYELIASNRVAPEFGNPKGASSLRPEKDAWASIMDVLLSRTDFNKLPSDLNKSLLMRVAALTSVRNDSGHKPKNRAARVKRDRELRTRFESANDVLRDFANAARSLRI